MPTKLYQPKPRILSKSEWGGTIVTPSGATNNPEYLIVHHTGDANNALADAFGSDEAGFMKRVQEIHMGKGYYDIGYNFGLGSEGTLMEGRSIAREGGHTLNGYNTKSIGIVALGNYSPEDCGSKASTLSSVQEDSLIDILAWLCYKYDIESYDIIGHRDAQSKDCPGSRIYDKLDDIRNKVAERLYEWV
ncbi:peptidoglycan recognition family protein [Wukongibacter baidiensis]|uniref:peptidoglycan recognition protein family protein n=1 Tax=Wukongibacter baidiensis TaxID=1723361 RepID=UPI003D7F9D5F